MLQNALNITVNPGKIYLTSRLSVYKTESFIRLTRKVHSIDTLISRIAESIFFSKDLPVSCHLSYMAETSDCSFTMFFKFTNKNDNPSLSAGDIVFYKYISSEKETSFSFDYLNQTTPFEISIRETTDNPTLSDFSKLYLVTENDEVNFPLLNPSQRKIVETENSNILVQGVAGSGKTNVCVEKIVYCACRNYHGRVLYTTFSRGLLNETKKRVDSFKKNIIRFLDAYKNGRVIFLDENHKKAIENKLGIVFDTDDDGKIIDFLSRSAVFLDTKVDYFLIEDIYKTMFDSKRVLNETAFISEYIGDIKNYRLSGALEKIKNLSPEIIYKEIYGMIFGKYESSEKEMLSREEYIEARKDSFSKTECEVIYTVALDYKKYLEKENFTDNNYMSKEMLSVISSPVYSIGIIDEAQDFTQVNLFLIKSLCLKLFCVGDALQMINPSYFGFGYLKKIMYGCVTGVSELKHNYRSSECIEKITEKLGELNIKRFGTHSFVIRGESVKSDLPSATVFVKEKNFASLLVDKRFDNVTVIVSSRKKKEFLRRKLGKIEILTVAEAKGLERNTVILCDLLSDNIEKWHYLQNMSLNRKTADENSVFRYYFNLFYVGISRAKQYLFVAENSIPDIFNNLFNELFDTKNSDDAIAFLSEIAGKTTLDDDELLERIRKFCQLEQYENAYFTAERLSTENMRNNEKVHIFVEENFLRYGNKREAGIEFWKRGMEQDAKKMFIESGDEELIPLVDACNSGGGKLDIDIVKFYPLLTENPLARSIIIDTIKNDYKDIMGNQKMINEILKTKRRKR